MGICCASLCDIIHICFFFLFFSLFCFLFLLFDSFSDFSFVILCFERELFDLFGFFFVGNDFLTRLLSDWFFFVYVLVKDFPLLGFFVCVFDCFFSDCRLVLDFLFFVFF